MPDRRNVVAGLALTLASRTSALAAVAPTDLVVLKAGRGTLSLAGASKASVLGYNGSVSGPLIRVRKGGQVSVRLENGLDQPTTISWHGVRNLNAMDGVAGLTQPAVKPGTAFDYRFTPPDPGTYWYHPHCAPDTCAQTSHGLSGLLIVDEEVPPSVDEDLPLVVADWKVENAGTLAPLPCQDEGGSATASLFTVNGQAAPLGKRIRPGSRVRMRLVNGCASRILVVKLAGAQASVIAIDGQPSELFRPADGILPIGPGSRFDLMFDAPLKDVAKVTLAVLDPDAPLQKTLVTIDVTGDPVPARSPIAKLPENPLLPKRIALERSVRRDVAISEGSNGRWQINGLEGPIAKPLFSVRRGTPVTLAFSNRSSVAQQMHIHGHCWRLLHDLDDGWDPYWRDSVLLAPGRGKHVAFVADNPGRWALVAGDLHRQVTGLATWFEVN